MNGITAERYVYDAFGNVNITDTEYQFPFRFTGQKLDPETGLYYYKARYYDPALGRFLQVDPIGYADQQNLYAYVGNDPVNLTDPKGKFGHPCNGPCNVGDFTKNLKGTPGGVHGPSLRELGSFAADFTPILGDLKGIRDAIADPSAISILAAGVGLYQLQVIWRPRV